MADIKKTVFVSTIVGAKKISKQLTSEKGKTYHFVELENTFDKVSGDKVVKSLAVYGDKAIKGVETKIVDGKVKFNTNDRLRTDEGYQSVAVPQYDEYLLSVVKSKKTDETWANVSKEIETISLSDLQSMFETLKTKAENNVLKFVEAQNAKENKTAIADETEAE